MDNQHKHIKGYRDLSEQEIALMNEAKELAAKVGEFCEKLQSLAPPNGQTGITIDGRWLAIGTTDLQKGFMAVIRSVARPESF